MLDLIELLVDFIVDVFQIFGTLLLLALVFGIISIIDLIKEVWHKGKQ